MWTLPNMHKYWYFHNYNERTLRKLPSGGNPWIPSSPVEHKPNTTNISCLPKIILISFSSLLISCQLKARFMCRNMRFRNPYHYSFWSISFAKQSPNQCSLSHPRRSFKYKVTTAIICLCLEDYPNFSLYLYSFLRIK